MAKSGDSPAKQAHYDSMRGQMIGTPEERAAAALAKQRRDEYIAKLDASVAYVEELESNDRSMDGIYRGMAVWLICGIRDGSFRIRHASDAATVLRAVMALFDHDRSDDKDKRAWRTQLQALAMEAANHVQARTGEEPQQDAAPPPLTDDGEK